MKKLVLALFVTVGSVAAQASCLQEAQFIGLVKNYSEVKKGESVKECFYQIEYTMFNSSMVCPLSIDEVYSHVFQDPSCSLKDGTQVSGIMNKNENGKVEIE